MNRNQEQRIVKVAIAVILALSVFVTARNIATYNNQMRITHAIFGYQLNCIRTGQEYVTVQKDKESYTDTFLRLWDWGDKRILPYEDYVRVKPYIGWYPEYKDGEYIF